MKISCAVLATAVLCTACTTIPQSPRDRFAESLKKQLAACWKLPADPFLPQKIRFRIRLKPDGALDGAPVLLAPPAGTADPKLLASSVAALKSCSPFKIPAEYRDRYDEWRDIRIAFDPSSL